MDILEEIKNDHDEMIRMTEEIEEAIEKGDSNSLTRTFDELSTLAAAHMDAEEKIFYPSIKKADKEAFYEAVEEHDLLRLEAKRLGTTTKGDEAWSAKFKVMKDLNEHHIEEEESNVFDIAREEITETERDEMGRRFEEAMGKATGIKAGARSSAGARAESSSGSR